MLFLISFLNLFEMLDVRFSLLRVLCPTEEEMSRIQKSIERLEEQWKELKLSHTPKLHILLDHTVEQVRLFGGIADLAKDFVEKSHQTGKHLDHLTAHMNCQCFRQQELVKIRRKWLMTNPLVQEKITTVKEASRR